MRVIRSVTIAVILAAGFLPAASPSWGSPAAMKGPPSPAAHLHPLPQEPDPSPLKLLALAAITFYRSYISPTQGPRCGFYPSCSAFGLQAVREHGAIRGMMMTTDRLTRCNLLKGPGTDYYLLPNGKLFDPVSRNLLSEP